MGKRDSADVDAINKVMEKPYWKDGDLDSFIDLFTDDAIWMPPGGLPVVGKEALRAWVSWAEDVTWEHFSTSTEEVVVAGDWAFARLAATMVMTPQAGEEATPSYLKGLQILQRQTDGSWRIARYIWNGNPPPEAES